MICCTSENYHAFSAYGSERTQLSLPIFQSIWTSNSCTCWMHVYVIQSRLAFFKTVLRPKLRLWLQFRPLKAGRLASRRVEVKVFWLKLENTVTIDRYSREAIMLTNATCLMMKNNCETHSITNPIDYIFTAFVCDRSYGFSGRVVYNVGLKLWGREFESHRGTHV